MPATVSVVETHFMRSGAEPVVTKFSVVESEAQRRGGQAARYRLTYVAPAPMKGVVILNDGHSVWRYNARKRLIARRASISAPTPPELEEGVAAIPIQSDGAQPYIEVGLERVASRPAEVLALRTRRSGRIIERRWVAVDSGRTLRFEQYAGRDAHVVRRVEVTDIHLLKSPQELAWAAGQLTPRFPGDVPIVEPGRSRSRSIAEDAAGRVQLPLHVRGFALQSVELMPAAQDVAAARWSGKAANTSMAAAQQKDLSALMGGAYPENPICDSGSTTSDSALTAKMTQFYYGKGRQGISVFVSRPPDAGKNPPLASTHPVAPPASTLVASPGWGPASLGGRRSGFARTSANGAAVAWAGEGGVAYITISRIPLADLLPIAQAFAANRDDAPATVANARFENNSR